MQARRSLIVVAALGAALSLTGGFAAEAAEQAGLEKLLDGRSPDEWSEVTVDTVRNVGLFLDVAVVPDTGIPFISYYEGVAQDLWIAHFVGSGGNCGPSSSWSCQVIDATGDVGSHNSIAVQNNGAAVRVLIAYHDATNGSLKVARGNCEGTSCNLELSTVESGNLPMFNRGRYTSAAFTALGLPWVAYQSWWATGNESVRVAYRDLMGSGNCGVGAAAGFWQCDTIVSAPGIGTGTDIVIDALGRAQMAFYDPVAGYPYHAIDVGSGGNCGPSNSWFCRTAHVSGYDYGRSISLFAAADGTPHMAFMDDSGNDLIYTRFVGAAGDCGFNSATSQFEWNCDKIAANIDVVSSNRTVAMAADEAGHPLIAYRDASDPMGPPVLRLAQPYAYAPAGSVPNCGPQNPLYTWVCTTLDNAGTWQEEAAVVSIAGSAGGATIAYHELDTYSYPAEGNLKVQVRFTPLFADGFNFGNFSAWSAVVP